MISYEKLGGSSKFTRSLSFFRQSIFWLNYKEFRCLTYILDNSNIWITSFGFGENRIKTRFLMENI